MYVPSLIEGECRLCGHVTAAQDNAQVRRESGGSRETGSRLVAIVFTYSTYLSVIRITVKPAGDRRCETGLRSNERVNPGRAQHSLRHHQPQSIYFFNGRSPCEDCHISDWSVKDSVRTRRIPHSTESGHELNPAADLQLRRL